MWSRGYHAYQYWAQSLRRGPPGQPPPSLDDSEYSLVGVAASVAAALAVIASTSVWASYAQMQDEVVVSYPSFTTTAPAPARDPVVIRFFWHQDEVVSAPPPSPAFEEEQQLQLPEAKPFVFVQSYQDEAFGSIPEESWWQPVSFQSQPFVYVVSYQDEISPKLDEDHWLPLAAQPAAIPLAAHGVIFQWQDELSQFSVVGSIAHESDERHLFAIQSPPVVYVESHQDEVAQEPIYPALEQEYGYVPVRLDRAVVFVPDAQDDLPRPGIEESFWVPYSVTPAAVTYIESHQDAALAYVLETEDQAYPLVPYAFIAVSQVTAQHLMLLSASDDPGFYIPPPPPPPDGEKIWPMVIIHPGRIAQTHP